MWLLLSTADVLFALHMFSLQFSDICWKRQEGPSCTIRTNHIITLKLEAKQERYRDVVHTLHTSSVHWLQVKTADQQAFNNTQCTMSISLSNQRCLCGQHNYDTAVIYIVLVRQASFSTANSIRVSRTGCNYCH